MTPGIALATLLERAQAGDQGAATQIYEVCCEPLRHMIRAILPSKLRRICDSDDFVQEAMASLFVRKFDDAMLHSPERLWRYLKRIAENKVRDASRKRLLSQRFLICLESNISDAAWDEIEAGSDLAAEDLLLLRDLAEDGVNSVLELLSLEERFVAKLLIRGFLRVPSDRQPRQKSERILGLVKRIEEKLGKDTDILEGGGAWIIRQTPRPGLQAVIDTPANKAARRRRCCTLAR